MTTPAKVEAIKAGEYVKRSPTSRKVYMRGEYDRATHKYTLQDSGVLSREVYVKKGTLLYVGFTY